MAREIDETIPQEGGAPMRALLALPEGTAPEGGWPGVVVIHDIFGFSEDVRRITRRFADSGYAAIAPALFDAAGPRGLCVVRTVSDLTRRRGPAFDRLDATQRKLAAHPQIDGGRIGITGFCMGGGFALFYAARGGVQVCAPYYGDTPKEADALRQVCPVIAGYGELDKSFAEQGRRLERHLQSLGIPHEVRIYPDVGHSYMNDLGDGLLAKVMRKTPLHAGYDENAAEDSWRRMLAFFEKHL
jgi:carboxymethylenebutenolidase